MQIKNLVEDLENNAEMTIRLHDNISGMISALCTSFDQKHLFSVGLDGNIFTFKLNLNVPPNAKEIEPQAFEFIDPVKISDITDPQFLSLEDQKQKNYRDERTRIINEKKSQMLEVLGMLKSDFSDVQNRNHLLPDSQKLSPVELELDTRITLDLEGDFQRQSGLVRRKMAFDVQKITLLKSKVENFLVNNLECWPIELLAIRYTLFDLLNVSANFICVCI